MQWGPSVNRPDYLVQQQQQALFPTVIVTVFEIDPARSPTRPISKILGSILSRSAPAPQHHVSRPVGRAQTTQTL